MNTPVHRFFRDIITNWPTFPLGLKINLCITIVVGVLLICFIASGSIIILHALRTISWINFIGYMLVILKS